MSIELFTGRRQIEAIEQRSNFATMFNHHGMGDVELAADLARAQSVGETMEDGIFLWQKLWGEQRNNISGTDPS
jgi:hypothetical protein